MFYVTFYVRFEQLIDDGIIINVEYPYTKPSVKKRNLLWYIGFLRLFNRNYKHKLDYYTVVIVRLVVTYDIPI